MAPGSSHFNCIASSNNNGQDSNQIPSIGVHVFLPPGLSFQCFSPIGSFQVIVPSPCHLCQVFELLKKQDVREKRALQLQGVPVCQTSFRKILGLGKHRFGRLRTSVLNQEQDCPRDQRFLPQKFARLDPSSVRPLVVEYLQRLYESTAEPLPEAFQVQTEIVATQPQGVVRKRGKRPRHLFKSDPADDKGMKGHKAEAKFLPPGTILEYLDLCRAEFPDTKIGRKVFCAVFCPKAN